MERVRERERVGREREREVRERGREGERERGREGGRRLLDSSHDVLIPTSTWRFIDTRLGGPLLLPSSHLRRRPSTKRP
jgi:hypothetical protein